jgi:hypothetical protein
MEQAQEFAPTNGCQATSNQESLDIERQPNFFLVGIFAWYFTPTYASDIIRFIFCRYHCGYGLQHHRGEPNHARFIKCGCLAHFLIKRLSIRLEVAKITFNHCAHT